MAQCDDLQTTSGVKDGKEQDTDPFLRQSSFQLEANVDVDTRKLRLKDALWQSQSRWRKKSLLDALVDSLILEILVGIVIAADLILTILTFTVSEEVAESTEVFAVGAVFLIVLLFDVILRIFKFRMVFFYRPLNWLECSVAVAGCVMLVFEGVDRAGCGGTCPTNRSTAGGGTSLGRSIRPAVKAWRIFRTFMQIANSRGGLHNQMSQQTHRFLARQIRLYLNDFLVIPKSNVRVVPGSGILHVEKAQVRSSVLKGLHLPLTITCGIVDLVHVKLNTKGSKDHPAVKGDESNHKMLVVLENILLVVGPGHHQEMPSPPWDFHAVRDAKQQLVYLLTQQLQAEAKQKVKLALASIKGSKKRAGMVSKALKSMAHKHVEQILWKGIHVSVHNIEFRYEDPANEFTAGIGALTGSGADVVGGIRLSAVTVRVAGVGEAEGLSDSDFRVKGKWRYDDDDGGDRPIEGEHSEAAETAHRKTIPRINLGWQKKKKEIHGLRVALQADGAAVFWNMHKPGEASGSASKRVNHKTVALPYTEIIEEGSGVDISVFMEEHHLTLRRERVRLALCREVESRMVHSVGRCAAREFARRLRDRVAAHQYVVMPFGCSIHAMARPPDKDAGTSSSSRNRNPIVDVSVDVSTMSVTPDISQAASLVWLFEYVKRWILEDKRFQWKPPPAELGLGHEYSTLACARWQYALQRVLCCIDPRHHWRSLDWIGILRRYHYRAAYLAALTKHGVVDQETVCVLQVGLPLKDLLELRREAAWVCAVRQLRRSQRVLLPDSENTDPSAKKEEDTQDDKDAYMVNVETGAGEDGDGDEDMENTMTGTSSKDNPTQPMVAAKSEKSDQDNHGAAKDTDPLASIKKGGLMAFQLHVSIGAAQMGILCPEPLSSCVRVPILLGQATVISLIVVAMAPRKVWQHVAPPAAIAMVPQEAPPPQRPACEFSIESVRMVFYAAPSGAWQLRRAFFCGGEVGPRGGRPGDDRRLATVDQEGPLMETTKGAPTDETLGREKVHAQTGICMRCCDMGLDVLKEDEVPEGTKGLWVFGVCVPALEVHALKPLLEAIFRTVKPAQPPPPITAAANATRYGIKTRLHKGKIAHQHGWAAASGHTTTRHSQSHLLTTGTHHRGLDLFSHSGPNAHLNSGHGHVPSEHSGPGKAQHVDGSLFWAHLLELHMQRVDKKKAEQMLRITEKAIGISGPLKGRMISGSVFFMGGLRADVLEPCTKDHWVLQAIHAPAGTLNMTYGGHGLQVAYEPASDCPGTKGGMTQSPCGWWFQTEAQANAMSLILSGERIDPGFLVIPGPYPDYSCAAEDGLEEVEEPPQSTVDGAAVAEDAAKSTWQKAVVRSLRYKLRESEKGLLPAPAWIPERKYRPNVPFCCQDPEMVARENQKALRRGKLDRHTHDNTESFPTRNPVFQMPVMDEPTMLAGEPGEENVASMWTPFNDAAYGDVDVWLESLSPGAVGLPRPEEAEELWVSLGCAPLRRLPKRNHLP